jgi:hypothetical protein
MSQNIKALIESYFETDTVAGLPDGHFIEGRLVPSAQSWKSMIQGAVRSSRNLPPC